MTTQTEVLEFIRQHGMIDTNLISNHISRNRRVKTEIFRLCNVLVRKNKITKTGYKKYALHNPVLTRYNKSILNRAKKTNSRVKIMGYKLTDGKQFNTICFIQEVDKYVSLSNITKSGFKQYRTNTILSAQLIDN